MGSGSDCASRTIGTFSKKPVVDWFELACGKEMVLDSRCADWFDRARPRQIEVPRSDKVLIRANDKKLGLAAPGQRPYPFLGSDCGSAFIA